MGSDISCERPERLLEFSNKRRLPVMLQTEAAECGLSCLAMIVSFHGYKIDLTSLRQRFSISSQGMTLKSLIDIAARMNLSGRALRLDIKNLDQLQCPCILHWGMNHFVTLREVHKNKVVIHDPAIGEREINASELSKNFTGVALELTPAEGFEKGEYRRKLRIRHFGSRIIGLKRSLLQIFTFSLLLQLFVIVAPFYMQIVVDDVILHGDRNLLLALALGFGLLLLVQTGTHAFRELLILELSNRLNIQMAANLFRHMIRLPADYFAKRHTGDIVSRFGSLDYVRTQLTTGVVTAIVDGLMATITLLAMFVYSVKLAIIVLIVVVLYALLRAILYRPLRLLTEESIISSAKQESNFMETVRSIQTIKLFQRENDRQSQWQNYLAESMNKNIYIARWNIGYEGIKQFLFGLENIIVIYTAALAVMGNLISVGMLFAFMSYKTRFIEAIETLITKLIELKMLGLHLDRLADIAFTPAEEVDQHEMALAFDENFTEEKTSTIMGQLEVRNLGYSHSEVSPPIFQNLNFSIQANETVAIIGPSGCGKTTLLKCLVGLLTPTEGEILVDGKPLKSTTHYRSQIAVVMQDDQLLSGTIMDNIACFSPQPDMEKVYSCAKTACIHEDILKMPMQYSSLVGDLGTSLSGGQKQRIILARALYRQPRILFLDEATSHLDFENESQVNRNLQRMEITRVLVAHSNETIKSTDRQISICQQ